MSAANCDISPATTAHVAFRLRLNTTYGSLHPQRTCERLQKKTPCTIFCDSR
jgi:hypothetical protein